jgi:TrmH family RNA methyltransferase
MGSLSKAEIKLIRSLHRKKGRKEHGLFILEGEKLLQEALKAGIPFEHLLLRSDAPLMTQFPNATMVSEKEMEQVSAMRSGSPALAVVKQVETGWRQPSSDNSRILALDGIADPGNLGTILRSADWFGVTHILLSDDCVDLYNPKTVQATMGSLFHISWQVGSLPQLLKQYQSQDHKVWVTHLKGGALTALASDQDPAILVIGSESHGVRPEVEACADAHLKIPGKGDAESLNASIAASIVLYEWMR